MKPKSRISRITIGRLYNLGSYEHVRYELAVDVPEGASAKKAFQQIVAILRAANPKPPISHSNYTNALDVIAKPGEWDKNITNSKERRKSIAQRLKNARDTVRTYDAWRKLRDRAIDALDDLGGTQVYKDAKEDWDDDQW